MLRKLVEVQYVRALAVLLVLCFHAAIRAVDEVSPAFAGLVQLGGAGVDLFFVVSGFIIWTITVHRPVSPGTFLIHRIGRIVPLYWLTTLIWTGIALVGLIPWVEVDAGHVVQSLFFIPHYNPSFAGKIVPVLVPGWTLNYEAFFYAIFALLLYVSNARRLLAATFALCALALLGISVDFSNAVAATFTSPLLVEFLLGIGVAYLWNAGLLPKAGAATAVLVVGCCALLLSSIVTVETDGMRLLVWGLPGAAIVMGALNGLKKLPRLPVLSAIGDASYSIYLTHILTLTVLAGLWKRVGPDGQTPFSVALFMAIALLLSCCVGWLTYRYFEEPMNLGTRSLLKNVVKPATSLAS